MADALLQAELLAACSGLGYSDGIKYYKEAECLETVKDLIRYLRRDDDSHQIRRALGETKVLQTDLIPIIKYYSDDKELFDVTLRLLVNLTNPVILLFKEELPEEKITRQQYLQMASHQQDFKIAFADEEFWKVLVTYFGTILNQDYDDREEEDRLVVERILILVRNILSVAASPEDEKRTDDDASVHDQVLWVLHLARFEDLILYIASSQNEQELCMHVIEIISLMLKEQDPSQLASAGFQRSKSEKEKDVQELSDIRKKEALQKKIKFQKHHNSRHSKFGGTFYVKNMKSISDNDLIAHKHISDISALNFDDSKRPKKTPKNRLPLKDVNITRRSTLAIRLFLQEFCIEFLNGAYNSLMYIVKDNLNRARAQEHDESYYLWAIKFFLEFNRSHQFQVELISETSNIQTFHYIQVQLTNYYEMMTTDKKKIPHWSKRMNKALKAYQELLMTLAFMDKSEVVSVQESSKVLKSKVFYVIEYRELVLILLQNYDEMKMSKTYLKDLVETTHIFLKLLEGFCGKHKHLVVQSKKRTKKRINKNKITSKAKEFIPLSQEELIQQWNDNIENLTSIVGEEKDEHDVMVPFDPVSDVPEEEQKENAMRKINKFLRKGQFKEAVSLIRTARDIWPEGIFGSQDISPENELVNLKEIFMANLNPNEDTTEPVVDEIVDDGEFDSEEDEEIVEAPTQEQELNFIEYVRRFAHIKVVQAYGLLFKTFFTNSDHTNHCILKLFHRLAWDCKIVAIFFQASIFRSFQKVMDQPGCHSHVHKDGLRFIKFVLRKYFEIAKTNDKVFMELLFWKTNREALEIECGYDGAETTKVTKQLWTEEEEFELQRLYDEFVNKDVEGKDVADLITENIINQNRSRRMIIKKLKEMSLIQDIKELSRKSLKLQIPKEFSEEEKVELEYLVNEHRDAMNPIDRILDNLTVKRPKHRILNQILEMGLIKDKKELRKKRPSKSQSQKGHKKSTGERFLSAQSGSDDENSDNSSANDERESGNESNSSSLLMDEELQNKQTSIPPPVVATPSLIKSALAKVVVNHKEGLQWIKELLEETADEREADGDFDPIPLLTVTEASSLAMDDDDFTEFLKLIGIHPPSSHQEMFWRIPSNVSIDCLRKRAMFITKGIDGQLEDTDNIIAETIQNNVLPSTQEKKKTKKKSKIDKENSNYDESTDDELNSTLSRKKKSFKKLKKKPFENSRKTALSDFNSQLSRSNKRLLNDDEVPNSPLSDNSNNEPVAIKAKKQRIVLASNFDSELSNEAIVGNSESVDLQLSSDLTLNAVEETNGNSTDSEPLAETPLRLKKMTGSILLSDDDSDTNISLVQKRKKSAAIIDSDDD